MSNIPHVQHFFDQNTNTFSYVVSDPISAKCAIIDSVLNYDAASARTSTYQADLMVHYITEHQLTVEWILETHVHADHLTAAQYLKQKLGGKIAMSQHIFSVQNTFCKIYNLDIKQFNLYQPFDYLFENEEKFSIGSLQAYNIPTPGHTPACLSYVVGNAVFVGDTLFMPDYGTARCDFPKGDAATLFDSVEKLYQLPPETRVFLCHDYLPEHRTDYCCETDILRQKTQNIHIHQGITKESFIKMREKRDESLAMPKLILPAIQVNMNAGKLPQPEVNGIVYLKLPVNYFL